MVDSSEIRSVVYKAISDTFKVSIAEINGATVAADVDGWNSVTNTLLFFEIEQRLNIDLPIEILLETADVDELCLEIEKYAGEHAASKAKE